VRRALALVVGTLLLWTAAPARANGDRDDDRDHHRPGQVRLNQVQVLGTHNSYHVQPGPSLFSLLRSFSAALADSLEYTHIPLGRQLATQGIRQFELDVFTDPAGGLYATPAGPRVVAEAGLPPDLPAHDPNGVLRRPGLKVFHVQDIDFRSTCLTLVRCLRTIERWSDDNPRHLPLMILLELKDDPIPDPGLGFVIPRQFGAADVDAVDRDIRSVFSERQLLTPDDVRGRHATLEEAVLTSGWPRLVDARGKVLFALDNEGEEKDLYLAGHPSLRGRVLFTSSRPGAPESAFVKLNDPLDDGALIRDLVSRGYIIRTRADADTVQARTGDTTMRDAAFASGAQYVSTDYVFADPRFGTGYVVDLPGDGAARCNPVNAPKRCTHADLGG
jgi:Phosphoinositide phospholipase C, Ca2+-dependent